mmetsp:Transcript_22129/g.48929  ORF Transcript_22129/g.48929 Transcript_22129/m.48929 type:complete len:217 (+) Transcript_22129:63-713(+)
MTLEAMTTRRSAQHVCSSVGCRITGSMQPLRRSRCGLHHQSCRGLGILIGFLGLHGLHGILGLRGLRGLRGCRKLRAVCGTGRQKVRADAARLAIEPFTGISATIRPREDPMAMLLVIHVIALILPSICPGEKTLAMHSVRSPLAGILSSVTPRVGALPMHAVVLEVTSVGGAISPRENTLATFHAGLVRALIQDAIWPILHPFPMLLVLKPLPLI